MHSVMRVRSDREVAGGFRGMARKTVDQCYDDRNAGGSREEVLHRQPDHLRVLSQ
jgi:hypothetical protein